MPLNNDPGKEWIITLKRSGQLIDDSNGWFACVANEYGDVYNGQDYFGETAEQALALAMPDFLAAEKAAS